MGRRRKAAINAGEGQQEEYEEIDIDDAYRNLATEIVRLAIQDYVKSLLEPDNQERVNVTKACLVKARAMFKAAQEAGENPDFDPEEAFDYVSKNIREAIEGGIYIGVCGTSAEKLMKALDETEHTNEGILFLCKSFLVLVKQAVANAKRLDNKRRERKQQLEEFFRSERCALYTNDMIDPDTIFGVCEKRARMIREGLSRAEDLESWLKI